MEEIAAVTRLAWTRVRSGYYLSGGKGHVARLLPDMLGAGVLDLRTGQEKRRLPLGRDLLAAFRAVEAQLLQEWSGAHGLIVRTSRWRGQPASEKQRDLLRRCGFPAEKLAALTKGEAQEAMARIFGR